MATQKNFRKDQKNLGCLTRKLGTNKGDSRCDLVSSPDIFTHCNVRAPDSAGKKDKLKNPKQAKKRTPNS